MTGLRPRWPSGLTKSLRVLVLAFTAACIVFGAAIVIAIVANGRAEIERLGTCVGRRVICDEMLAKSREMGCSVDVAVQEIAKYKQGALNWRSQLTNLVGINRRSYARAGMRGDQSDRLILEISRIARGELPGRTRARLDHIQAEILDYYLPGLRSSRIVECDDRKPLSPAVCPPTSQVNVFDVHKRLELLLGEVGVQGNLPSGKVDGFVRQASLDASDYGIYEDQASADFRPEKLFIVLGYIISVVSIKLLFKTLDNVYLNPPFNVNRSVAMFFLALALFLVGGFLVVHGIGLVMLSPPFSFRHKLCV